MPKVKCTWCEKAYEVPDSAIGKVATCACGKKFRVGGQTTHDAPDAAKLASRKTPAHLLRTAPPNEPAPSDTAPPASGPEITTVRSATAVARKSGSPAKVSSSQADVDAFEHPLLHALDVAFRITCVAIALGLWFWFYLVLKRNADPQALLGPLPFSLLILPILLAAGGGLAYLGLNYQPGSGKVRLGGLTTIAAALLIAFTAIVMEYLINAALGVTFLRALRGMAVWGAIVFAVLGLVQAITGSDVTEKFRDLYAARG